MNEYRYDKRYGFLIANALPFNFISTLMAPVAWCIKDEGT